MQPSDGVTYYLLYYFCLQRDNGTARCPMCRADVTMEKLVEVPPDTQVEDCTVPADMPWESSSKVRSSISYSCIS